MNKLTGFAILVLSAILVSCGGSANSSSEPSPTKVSEVSSTRVVGTPTPQIPLDDRLRIPSINVDAPIGLRTVDKTGSLSNPDGADDVVIYDFSQNWPSLGGLIGSGNAVISGRLDSGSAPCKGGTVPPPCKAVFWDLNQVRRGSEVQIFWKQHAYVYSVVAICNISNTERFDPVVQKTSAERVTLTTQGGTFDQEKRRYSHTLVVIAEKASAAVVECPSGTTSGLPPAPAATPRPGS